MLKFIFLYVGLLAFSSCALVFTGLHSKIIIESKEPVRTQVFLNDVFLGTTPLNIKISKKSLSQAKCILTLKANGYEDEVIVIDKKTRTGFLIWDICSGGIPTFMDYETGAIYKPIPKKINCVLQKKHE